MNNEAEKQSQRLLDDAVKFHGHLCGGQVLGVRIAMEGLRELGIEDPRGAEGRDLVIFVEIDRCATDAIIAVTGRTPGRRSIKMMDYGKTAATFVEARSGKAVRVSLRGDSNEKVERLAQTSFAGMDAKQANLAALAALPEADLLTIQEVSVRLRPEDLPGQPLESVRCHMCGETVRDRRHVNHSGRILCRPCAQGTDYYALPGHALPPLGVEGFIESEMKRMRHESAGH